MADPIIYAKQLSPKDFFPITLKKEVSASFFYGGATAYYDSPYFPHNTINLDTVTVTDCPDTRELFFDEKWKVFWVMRSDCDNFFALSKPFRTSRSFHSIYDLRQE